MIEDLQALLDRLMAEQRHVLGEAAKSGVMPPDRALGRIADLEQAIAATQELIGEMQDRGM